MVEEKEDENAEAAPAPHVQLEGPPWGEYSDPDLAYVRGQIGSVGSGALGGWSCANNGGFIARGGEETNEVLAEVRRILAAKAEARQAHAGDWSSSP
jgi:hypothetical protein